MKVALSLNIEPENCTIDFLIDGLEKTPSTRQAAKILEVSPPSSIESFHATVFHVLTDEESTVPTAFTPSPRPHRAARPLRALDAGFIQCRYHTALGNTNARHPDEQNRAQIPPPWTEPIPGTRANAAAHIHIWSPYGWGNNVNYPAALPYQQYSPLAYPKAARPHSAAASIPFIPAQRSIARQARREPQAENASTDYESEGEDP